MTHERLIYGFELTLFLFRLLRIKPQRGAGPEPFRVFQTTSTEATSSTSAAATAATTTGPVEGTTEDSGCSCQRYFIGSSACVRTCLRPPFFIRLKVVNCALKTRGMNGRHVTRALSLCASHNPYMYAKYAHGQERVSPPNGTVQPQPRIIW